MFARMHPGALALLLVCWLGISPGGVAQDQPYDAEDYQQSLTSLDAEIATIIRTSNIPSVSYAIIQPGKPVHINSLGVSDRDSAKSVSADGLYRIASVSKMFVAIAAMQLKEQGKLDPEARVGDVLPDFEFDNPWEETHPLKVKHLLESTTGWDDLSLMEFVYEKPPGDSLAEALTVNPDSYVSRWPPGTRHAYSNSAAVVAARVIETITGQPYAEYVDSTIFTPLGMDNTTFDAPGENAVTGYSNGVPVPHLNMLTYPAGGAVSTIEDLTQLLTLFLNRGAPLLSADSVKRMERSETTNAGQFAGGYGVYNFAMTRDGWPYRGHDGAMAGWLSMLAYSPDTGSGFVAVQSSDDQRTFNKINRKLSRFIARNNSLPDFDVLPDAKPAPWNAGKLMAQPVPQAWQAMSGYYRPINPRIQKQDFIDRLGRPLAVSIAADSAHLASAASPGFERDAIYIGNDTWVNDKGAVVMTRAVDPLAGEVIHYRDMVLAKTNAFDVYADKVVLLLWLLSLLTALVYSPVWLINKARGKITSRPGLKLRSWMSRSAVSALLFIILVAVGMSDPFGYLAAPGVVSVGITMLSVVFALVTVFACWIRIRYRGAETSKWLRGFTAVYLVLQLIVVVYLFNFGVIGLLSWT